MNALEKAGCPFERRHFSCEDCPCPSYGYFEPSQGVVVCANHVQGKAGLLETLRHELIHAYDYCTKSFAFSAIKAVSSTTSSHTTTCAMTGDQRNDIQLACSEIRAASMSGDCRWVNEFLRMNWGRSLLAPFRGQHDSCVKRRAILSLTNAHHMSSDKAEDLVDRAFPACIRDYSPFVAFPY